jgi:glycosyltransferase involved in cell wall biosynthesis
MLLAVVRDQVDISVVIPTFNRVDRLMRVLGAIERLESATGDQEFSFEVVVVSDGSTDGTAETVRSTATPFPVRLDEQSNSGPAAARNRGIELARGGLVVFLDDDVIPEPGLLAAHVARHLERDGVDAPVDLARSDLVVIGPMLTPDDIELAPWVAWEQHQLEKQYRAFESDPSAHARQFYTGNASVSIERLRAVGGFDTTYRRAEDVELAHRLATNGASFVFAADARGVHHADRSLDSWSDIAYSYGRNDVLFGTSIEPVVLGDIRGFFSERSAPLRGVVRFGMRIPAVGRVAGSAARSLGVIAAGVGARRVSRSLLSVSYNLDYYRGVRDELGGPTEFAALVRGDTSSELVAWFVLEQTLGHITHGKNLRAIVPTLDGIRAEFIPVEAELDGPARRIPGWTNWTVRAGVRARRALRGRRRDGWVPEPDVMFVHSQVPAVLLGRWMDRIPTVVSLDATPAQYDELGDFYRHDVGPPILEAGKRWANERCYERARHLVTWSAWAKEGLVAGYGVDPDRITVIAPGVDVERWAPVDGGRDDGPLQILFVGGDLARKGGDDLLTAARRLREDQAVPEFEVHLVTPTDVEPEDGVVVHHGLTANSPELIARYHRADVFCLPTLGDCLPMVLAEAGAAGLPLVSTSVGAIDEIVRDGETGRLVAPSDVDALTIAVRDLLVDDDLRRRCGDGAHRVVQRDHDARANAARLVDVLRTAAADDAGTTHG